MKEILKDYQLLIGSLIVASAILYSNDSTNVKLSKIARELDTMGSMVSNAASALQDIETNTRRFR
jgi:hypothetical protein